MPAQSNKSEEIHATRSSRVAATIRAELVAGQYAPGALLPQRRQLARQYGVSLATLEIAIKSLVSEGVLRAENGRGTFVCGRFADPEQHSEGGGQSERRAAGRHVFGIVSFVDPLYQENLPDRRRNSLFVIEAFERAVTKAGGLTHFSNLFSHPQTPEYVQSAIDQMIEEFGIEGVLIAAPRFQFDVFQSARLSRSPAVVVEEQASSAAVRQVYYDSRDEGFRAASVLFKAGYDRLVYVAPYHAYWVDERRDGLLDASLSRDAAVESYVNEGAIAYEHIDDQYDLAVDYVKSVPLDRIEGAGVVACNDAAGVALMEHAASVGLVAGRDYSIVGFDDMTFSRMHGLATFRPPLARLGEKAAEMLFAIAAGEDPPMRACLNSEFVMRKSIRQPETGHLPQIGRAALATVR